MQARERIPGELVRKYKSEIIFLVSRNYYYIQVVEPRTAWLPKLPYEISLQKVEKNIDTLSKLLVDLNEERFGIAIGILNKIIKEKIEIRRAKRIDKFYQMINLPTVEEVFVKQALRRTRSVYASPLDKYWFL